MKSRIMLGTLLVVGVLGAATLASGGAKASSPRQWTIVNFVKPVSVQGRVVMGAVMIVHDTLSFHCTPVHRAVAASTTLSVANGRDVSCKRLVEYQLAGESEAHAIPER